MEAIGKTLKNSLQLTNNSINVTVVSRKYLMVVKSTVGNCRYSALHKNALLLNKPLIRLKYCHKNFECIFLLLRTLVYYK